MNRTVAGATPRLALALCLAAALVAATTTTPAHASKQPVPPTAVIEKIGIDQNLGAAVPLDLAFRDETGAPVRLGQYFSTGKPVLLALVYYRCPGLCTMTLNGMSRAFRPLPFTPGKEFEVVTVSIDPNESHTLAAEKKAEYLKQYGRPEAASGWHFLTGDAASIESLARTVGFRYLYEPNTNQYAHAAGIMLLTPDGKLSRYFYGLEYSTRDLRWGIVEASDGKVGTLADTINLLCYAYDPMSGKYGFAIMNALRFAAGFTVLALGGFVFFMHRRDRRLAAAGAGRFPPSPGTPGGGRGEGPASEISNSKSEISNLKSPQATASLNPQSAIRNPQSATEAPLP